MHWEVSHIAVWGITGQGCHCPGAEALDGLQGYNAYAQLKHPNMHNEPSTLLRLYFTLLIHGQHNTLNKNKVAQKVASNLPGSIPEYFSQSCSPPSEPCTEYICIGCAHDMQGKHCTSAGHTSRHELLLLWLRQYIGLHHRSHALTRLLNKKTSSAFDICQVLFGTLGTGFSLVASSRRQHGNPSVALEFAVCFSTIRYAH